MTAAQCLASGVRQVSLRSREKHHLVQYQEINKCRMHLCVMLSEGLVSVCVLIQRHRWEPVTRQWPG